MRDARRAAAPELERLAVEVVVDGPVVAGSLVLSSGREEE
jgi:hypothetical protein